MLYSADNKSKLSSLISCPISSHLSSHWLQRCNRPSSHSSQVCTTATMWSRHHYWINDCDLCKKWATKFTNSADIDRFAFVSLSYVYADWVINFWQLQAL